MPPESARQNTVDADEIARFARVSDQWWDERGPFAPIHRINPTRLHYIKSVVCAHHGGDTASLAGLTGLRILDIGCGGGLACEPLSRLGADVTGIDADATAISAAQAHAGKSGLDITYLNTASTELSHKHTGRYDVVLALEIVEHVSNVDSFVQSCADLCAPGGIVIISTLNKTLKSLALGKIAAEYILRWVPAGTHDWKKFIRPSALTGSLRRAGLVPYEAKGLVFHPLKNEFAMSDHDLDVNYFITSRKDK